jgi:hypothetical protein
VGFFKARLVGIVVEMFDIASVIAHVPSTALAEIE